VQAGQASVLRGVPHSSGDLITRRLRQGASCERWLIFRVDFLMPSGEKWDNVLDISYGTVCPCMYYGSTCLYWTANVTVSHGLQRP